MSQNDALLQTLLVKQNQILAKLNALTEDFAASGNAVLDVFFEREFYRDFETGNDFRERFLRLVKGLDQRSVETVVQCLQRVRKIRGCSDRYLSLYTAEEQAEYRHMKEHFSRQILQLSGDCCFYDGWMLPKAAFEPSVFIDQCGFRHLRYPERTAGKAVIDAGAYIGDSALLFSKLVDGPIHAFEPAADNYALMLKTLAINDIEDRVIPRKMALGAEPGNISLARSIVPSANTQVKNSGVPYVGAETVPVVTLDDYVREHRLNVGLIKIDVEGAEQQLLRGAVETLRTMRPALLVSIYHNASDFLDIKPMLEEMDLGYRFSIRHPAIGTVMTETMLIAEVD